MNLETEVSRDLWLAIRRSYESQAWSNAIKDSIYFLSDAVRSKTGLQSDGAALAGQAFGGKKPKLQINRMLSESEQNVQAGVEQLFRGIYQAVRNPRSHEQIEDSQKDADSIIVFIDYLLRLIGHAKGLFSIDELVKQVTDESFVGNERYSLLLISEIPQHLRGQTALAVYEVKKEADGQKLQYFFSALLPQLSEKEVEEFFDAVSIELRDNKEEEDLRTLLQLLDPKYWTRIKEVSRLRAENRLIQSCRDGRYSRTKEKCVAGALGTWSIRILEHFSLKEELLNVLEQKVQSASEESQDYVFRFMFASIGKLAESPTTRLRTSMLRGLKAGDVRYRDALSGSFDGWGPWNREIWGTQVAAAYDAFVPQEATPTADLDDDIPF